MLDPGIDWGSWQVPVWGQLLVVLAGSGLLLMLAVARFARTE